MTTRVEIRPRTKSSSTSAFMPIRGVVQRRLADQSEHVAVSSDAQEALHSPGQSRFEHDFSRVRVGVRPPRLIQPKLTVSEPGDRYEREADRVAEAVTCAPVSGSLHPGLLGSIQGAADTGRTHAFGEVTEELEWLKDDGEPLSTSIRSFFEPRFGIDFSQVRVHTGEKALESARAVKALAYTAGRHIVFGARQYAPRTSRGRRLLAHELAHTLQQTQGSQLPAIQRYVRCLSPEDEECERNPGEAVRSRQEPMKVESVTGPVSGLLISNFAIGDDELKPNLQNHPNWANYWGQMVTNPDLSWEILGFSDCTGERSTNLLMRWQRAIAVNNALPQQARDQVVSFSAAPLDDCMDSDATEAGRAHNRSALIRQRSTTYTFDPQDVEPEYVACFDGDTVFVNKNGRSHQCPAVTGNIGDPTPNGAYCIREQGEAQLGATLSRPFRDTSDWYLLEPQFSTTRSRMHLHPGSASSGCVTVTDSSCFGRLADILNSSGRITRPGYDGYPPGNSEDVDNPEEQKTCVGILLVNRTEGGCSLMETSDEDH